MKQMAVHSEFQVLLHGRYRTMTHVTNLTGPRPPNKKLRILPRTKKLTVRVEEWCLLKVQALYVASSAQRVIHDSYVRKSPARFRLRIPDGSSGWHLFSFRAEVIKWGLNFNTRSRGPVSLLFELKVLGRVKYGEMTQ